KTNTRRRKLLTVRRLFRYLSRRNQLAEDPATRVPAPHKVEKVPESVDGHALIEAIRNQPAEGEIQFRNRLLLWTLAESGCQVSELPALTAESFQTDSANAWLEVGGKNPRRTPVSRELAEEVRRYWAVHGQSSARAAFPRRWLFEGFN